MMGASGFGGVASFGFGCRAAVFPVVYSSIICFSFRLARLPSLVFWRRILDAVWFLGRDFFARARA